MATEGVARGGLQASEVATLLYFTLFFVEPRCESQRTAYQSETARIDYSFHCGRRLCSVFTKCARVAQPLACN